MEHFYLSPAERHPVQLGPDETRQKVPPGLHKALKLTGNWTQLLFAKPRNAFGSQRETKESCVETRERSGFSSALRNSNKSFGIRDFEIQNSPCRIPAAKLAHIKILSASTGQEIVRGKAGVVLPDECQKTRFAASSSPNSFLWGREHFPSPVSLPLGDLSVLSVSGFANICPELPWQKGSWRRRLRFLVLSLALIRPRQNPRGPLSDLHLLRHEEFSRKPGSNSSEIC